MKILSFGSLNIDYVYRVEHFVRPGETISSDIMNVYPGGKGLNQSIALARSGANVYHAGAVGVQDGNMLIDVLNANNVNTQFIRRTSIHSGHAIIQVNDKGQNSIILFGGANKTITDEHIDSTLCHFERGDFIILQNEINNLGYIIAKSRQMGLKVVLNPSPMNEEIFGLPLEYVDYFILNEVEAKDICKNSDVDELLEALGSQYPNAVIILTLGKSGVLYKEHDVILRHGVYDVPVVDTTAAGDTFTGYFFGCLSQKYDVAKSLDLASRAASLSVSRPGASTSIPRMEEVLMEPMNIQKELPHF